MNTRVSLQGISSSCGCDTKVSWDTEQDPVSRNIRLGRLSYRQGSQACRTRLRGRVSSSMNRNGKFNVFIK